MLLIVKLVFFLSLSLSIAARGGEPDVEAMRRNKREGDAFLLENAKKPDVRHLGNGVQYRVIKDGGMFGGVPDMDSVCEVTYECRLLNDKIVDHGEHVHYLLSRVIAGWSAALTRMHVGDHWEIFIPASEAYGIGGRGDKIPPNAVIIFTVQLHGIRSPTLWESVPDEMKSPAMLLVMITTLVLIVSTAFSRESHYQGVVIPLECCESSSNPRVFMDITINRKPAGRLTFELFEKMVPRACENFRALCTGELGKSKATNSTLHYKGSRVHRIVPDFLFQVLLTHLSSYNLLLMIRY
jgi:hypothetical protein